MTCSSSSGLTSFGSPICSFFQPYWPLWCSSTPSSLLPQGLCTCSSCYFACPFSDLCMADFLIPFRSLHVVMDTVTFHGLPTWQPQPLLPFVLLSFSSEHLTFVSLFIGYEFSSLHPVYMCWSLCFKCFSCCALPAICPHLGETSLSHQSISLVTIGICLFMAVSPVHRTGRSLAFFVCSLWYTQMCLCV